MYRSLFLTDDGVRLLGGVPKIYLLERGGPKITHISGRAYEFVSHDPVNLVLQEVNSFATAIHLNLNAIAFSFPITLEILAAVTMNIFMKLKY